MMTFHRPKPKSRITGLEMFLWFLVVAVITGAFILTFMAKLYPFYAEQIELTSAVLYLVGFLSGAFLFGVLKHVLVPIIVLYYLTVGVMSGHFVSAWHELYDEVQTGILCPVGKVVSEKVPVQIEPGRVITQTHVYCAIGSTKEEISPILVKLLLSAHLMFAALILSLTGFIIKKMTSPY